MSSNYTLYRVSTKKYFNSLNKKDILNIRGLPREEVFKVNNIVVLYNKIYTDYWLSERNGVKYFGFTPSYKGVKYLREIRNDISNEQVVLSKLNSFLSNNCCNYNGNIFIILKE